MLFLPHNLISITDYLSIHLYSMLSYTCITNKYFKNIDVFCV